MSLGNFFEKAALSAASILKQFDWQTFSNTLESKIIGIYFSSEALGHAEAKIALEMSVNLLARLYPRLAIEEVGSTAQAFRQQMIRVAQGINPQIDIYDTVAKADICLIVGENRPKTDCPTVYFGSNGWIALVSTEQAVQTGSSDNPFGASAAACIAVANAFRFVFEDQLEVAALDKSISLSLVDVDPAAVSPENPQLKQIDIGIVHLVGIGAIGNAAIWVLQRLSKLAGVLHLIDHETVDVTNLQRYVLADQNNIGTQKTALASGGWKSNLVIAPHQLKWAEYLAVRDDWNFQHIAVAVDSAEDRCYIQSALPREITNAWTRAGNLGLSRHSFLGNQACLTCLYLPEGQTKNEDELIAEAIGLPNASREIRHMLFCNIPVNRQLIDRIASARQIAPNQLGQFEGKSVRTFYHEAVCGGILLRLTRASEPKNSVEVPMAFQSALAGIFLAAELVISAGKLRSQMIPTTTQIDLLKPIGPYLNSFAAKNSTNRCICQDPHYISAFKKKYSIP